MVLLDIIQIAPGKPTLIRPLICACPVQSSPPPLLVRPPRSSHPFENEKGTCSYVPDMSNHTGEQVVHLVGRLRSRSGTRSAIVASLLGCTSNSLWVQHRRWQLQVQLRRRKATRPRPPRESFGFSFISPMLLTQT